MIDLSSDFGIHIKERLQREGVIWLTTVSSDGTPQPNPVWFHWDGESFLIYTKPDSKKLSNITRNPNVSLNLEGATTYGGDVVVFNGIASIEKHDPEPHPGYVEKYQKAVAKLGGRFDEIYQEYRITIRVIPTRVRGS